MNRWKQQQAKGRKIIFLLLWVVICGACIHEWEVTRPIPLVAERTVLVYLAADNNLSHEAVQKQSALLAGWEPSLGNLIIFSDTYQGKPILMRAVMHNGKAFADTVKTYANDNSASAELLSEVIADTRRLAPAPSYGFIVFSHATGWLPTEAFVNPLGWKLPNRSLSRSIFVDGKREMELADFTTAIPDGAFDFIAFDMCFMAGIEVAYALRHKATYIIASAAEVLSPGFSPIYPQHLAKLYATTPDLIGFASASFAYFDKQQGLYRSATISVIKTKALEPLAILTREMAPTLSQAQTDQLQYYDRNGKPHLFFDLGDYLRSAAQTTAQRTYIDEALSQAIIFKCHTDKLINIDIRLHSGLSVYVPQQSLPNLNTAYLQTEWSKATQ